MLPKKPPKSLLYYPSTNSAVTKFRHEVLLDHIEDVNKKSNKPAQFYLTTDGLTAGDRYGIDQSLAPWHIEHSLNFLEANGKVRLFRPNQPFSGDIAAVVSELVSVIMPSEANSQDVPSSGTKQ